jgi:hypothetical protein
MVSRELQVRPLEISRRSTGFSFSAGNYLGDDEEEDELGRILNWEMVSRISSHVRQKVTLISVNSGFRVVCRRYSVVLSGDSWAPRDPEFCGW